MELEQLLVEIENADMILVGLGKEFEQTEAFKDDVIYQTVKENLQKKGLLWVLPAIDDLYRKKHHKSVLTELTALANALEKKNYFVVSTAINSDIEKISWKAGRLVMPCGSLRLLQCSENCGSEIKALSETEYEVFLHELEKQIETNDIELEENILGKCELCHQRYILNSVYAEQYDENGYLPAWEIYTKWLQGTLNKKLLILELGVGLQFPSVIRWPFERIAYLNQKARFVRVNKHLPQLTEQLSEKGVSIVENAIDWLKILC